MRLVHECKGIALDGCSREILVNRPPNETGESEQTVVDGYRIVSQDLDDPHIAPGSVVAIKRHIFPCVDDGRFNAALEAYIQKRETSNQSSQATAARRPDIGRSR
jgi:hypothetical protein